MTNGDPGNPLLTESEQRMQLFRLRFESSLEAEFREQFERNARTPRMVIMLISILMIAATPLYDASIMHAPQAFLELSHFLQFGVQIPSIALALLFAARPSLYRWSPQTMILCCMVTGAGVMTQHIVGRQMGFDMPHDFTAITVAATLILGRLRLWVALPWALLLMVATTAAQLQAFGMASFYDAVSAWMLASISAVTAYLLEHSFRQNWYRGKLLEFQATRDSLTGLPNRRHFDLELRRLVRDAIRQHSNVALLILDIDHFKNYNDRHGHPAGDQCLRTVGEWLGSAMRRQNDFCARIGGEEFAAVWFDASPDNAHRLADALRDGIRLLAVEHSDDGTPSITASGGFAQVIAPSRHDDPDRIAAALVERADSALYAAKRAGRSRMVIAERDHQWLTDEV